MGIDIGKNRFRLVGMDDKANILIRRCFTRDKLIEYLARVPQMTIGMGVAIGWPEKLNHLDIRPSLS
ncbi:hypothetical protein ACLECX_15845 [Lonsdalea quercina]|nr:hypothetical protein [Lonsdalea quercina]